MPILGSRGAASASGFGGIGGGSASALIQATGGNDVSVCGDYRIHTFSSPGTFSVTGVEACTPGIVDYMVVAGGGGSAGDCRPGGAGAGGFRESQHAAAAPAWTASPLKSTTGITVSASPGSYPITVGAGELNNLLVLVQQIQEELQLLDQLILLAVAEEPTVVQLQQLHHFMVNPEEVDQLQVKEI